MAPVVILLGAILGAVVDLQTADAIGQTSIRRAYNPAKTPGLLRVSSANPRYFADDRGRIVYLTGSHTWNNFKEHSTVDPPAVFDYTEYLDFLEQPFELNWFNLRTGETHAGGVTTGGTKNTFSSPFLVLTDNAATTI